MPHTSEGDLSHASTILRSMTSHEGYHEYAPLHY